MTSSTVPPVAGWRAWWARRDEVDRVRFYTEQSLYVISVLLIGSMGFSAAARARTDGAIAGSALATAVIGAATLWALRGTMSVYPVSRPIPRGAVATLGAVVVAVSLATVVLDPAGSRFGLAGLVATGVSLGLGALRGTRILVAVVAGCALLAAVTAGQAGMAVYGAALAAFLIFTVQTSLWLLDLVRQLDRARDEAAELAVTRERLRFSQDVHDVMGRRLSTIAVQAELAAALAERSDPRASTEVLGIRATAHEALREARELARGYRPLDLATEIEGAVSLLRSAGISTQAALEPVPAELHEPVARVVRESVTNILRHSAATRVTLSYRERVLEIRNDAPHPASGERTGSGLATLARALADEGVPFEACHRGSEFVVRADFGAVVLEGAGA